MDESSNYEAPHLGQNDVLPAVVKMANFVAARGKEVQVMRKTLASSATTKLAFQKLPVHIRRRAMSHNVKRLPRRVREIHKNQFNKSGAPQKSKRPSRKYVRRPYNLLEDYVRRKKRIIWLDTHIWHAKRFHMVEKWGYKLGYTPCDRAFRACYRATTKHCLIQDYSYYSCIELEGDRDVIINSFKSITNPKNGLSLAAKIYEYGKKEGNIFVYNINGKGIGDIRFMWKPNNIDSVRTIWIWIHPAFYKEILDTLISIFKLTFTLELNLISVYSNEAIILRELKGELSRFRLTGPLSTAVLHNCLIPWSNSDDQCVDWIDTFDEDQKSMFLQLISNQQLVWKNLENVSGFNEIQPHTILSMVVKDPRYNIPKKKSKALPEYDTFIKQEYSAINIADSPIWDESIRKFVRNSKLSNKDIAEKRKELLVPGTELKTGNTAVPIILIQRPGRKSAENTGYGHGWDIIIPGGWSQPFWISLIMWGARSAGLKETDCILFESGVSNPLYPDTQAGLQNETEVSNKSREEYFKKPPNKRINYNKFNVSSPLTWNWKLLLTEWNADAVDDFYVLRNRDILKSIQDSLNEKCSIEKIDCKNNCLVPVRILTKKGIIKKFGIICLPKQNDLNKLPVEPKCNDPLQQKRKDLRLKHKALLKRLRKRRVRAKNKGKIIPIDKEVLSNYTKEMRALWLPETKTVRHCCSREVIGFVKTGDFSFSLAHGSAIGYITLESVYALMCLKQKNTVLLRNTNSLQYLKGTLEIICE